MPQGPLISPNLHVALVHYPLAFLVVGTLIEAFAFMWRRSTFRVVGRWLILLGALSAIPAVYSGIYALRDVLRVDPADESTWAQIKTDSPIMRHPQVWTVLRNHLLFQSVATAVIVTLVIAYVAMSDRWRGKLYFPLFSLLFVAVAGTGVGAWFGGEAIYRKGVAVEPVHALKITTTPTTFEERFPPVELHTIMAGVTLAVAVAAIGLSVRRLTVDVVGVEVSTPAPAPGGGVRSVATSATLAKTFNPEIEFDLRPFVPVGRFWMLTSLLAMLTVCGGLFVLYRSASIAEVAHGDYRLVPGLLWKQIKHDPGQPIERRWVHAAAGTGILVLPLLAAGIVRFLPRQKLLLTLVTLLLVAVVAIQTWIGVLMLFDSPIGPVTKYNPAAAIDVPQP